MFSGPAPAAGTRFCFVCAATWKRAAFLPIAAAVKEAEVSGEPGTEAWFALKAPGRPAPAVAPGLYAPLCPPPLGNGMCPLPVDLCWSHLMMFDLRDSPIIPASGPFGGAVPLDGSPRP